MDMSHTSGNYAWNDSNIRHMKYESCSPTNSSSDTNTQPTLIPITLATPTHHPLVTIPHAHRHPYHHLTTYNSVGDSHSLQQCSAGGEGSAVGSSSNNNVGGRVDSPLLVDGGGQQQQLNFATNNNELDMDCGESTVTAYGSLVTYRTGGMGGIGKGSSGCSGNLGISSSNRVSRQDPLSHRIIEKRRRDRMNNCLADLSRLIPAEYLKKGRGRVEKTEIIEMAIMHMKYLQHMNHYSLGHQDCMSETLRFLVEVEGHFPRSPLCVRLLAHLQQHRDAVCVRRGSGGSTSSTSHSPVGGGNNSMGGEGAMAAMVLGSGGECNRGFEGGGGNGISTTTTPTATPTPSCHFQQPPLSSPTPPPASSHSTLTPSHVNCPKQPQTSSCTQSHPHCVLKPPKLEPNNNEEDYQHPHTTNNQQQHGALSPPCAGGLELEDGDGCSTLDEGEEHHERDLLDSKCSLQQRVQQHIQQLDRQERHSEGYKYKNDIKLRFTQDVIGSSSRRDSNGSTENHSSASPPPLHHHHSDICQQQSPKLHHSHPAAMSNLRSPSNSDLLDIKDTSFAIPIFALHNKGTFYVPLTVDYRALLPYLSGVDLTTWPKDMVLHPVAINVNFQTRKGHG